VTGIRQVDGIDSLPRGAKRGAMDIDTPNAHVFRFGVFELDTASRELHRHGLKVRLPDQSFQILKTLLARPGEVVTRDELRQVLWTAETFVDFEVGLNSAVRKLREALDDVAGNPRFVETLPRRGYRFVASVSVPPLAPEPVSIPAFERALEQAGVAPPSSVLPAAPRWRLAGWFAAASVAVVLVFAAAGVLYQRGGFVALRAGPGAEPNPSLVVLPFENLTGDPGQEYLVDSVTDTVSAHLAEVAHLDVISRTSARQYRQTVKRLPEIGKELQVDWVVEGTVARSGTAVHITTRLVRAATDRNVWAHRYEGDLSDMLPLQQRIASEITVAAGHRGPEAGRGRTPQSVNPRAYDAYARALTAKGLQRYEGFRRAAAYLDEAIAIQPDFAEAYAELAIVQLQFLYGGPLSPHEIIPKAEAAARKALTLDDTLATAHRSLGLILSVYHWRPAEGDKAMERAAALQGIRDEISSGVSAWLSRRGRFDEAIAAAERGRRLDPLSFNAQMAVGSAYRAAKQYDRSITEIRRAFEMSPGHNRGRFQLGVTFMAMGRFADAIPEFETAARPVTGHNSRIEAYLGYAYAVAGRPDDARAVLKELEAHRRDQYVSSFGIALIHDALGEKELALAALRRARDDRAVEFGLIEQYPPFKTIASEPEFQAVMRQVGL
jgi:TolB-like protein/DNA-binding winged helix-turn-helix (wHTH) protein/Flp pilus assembly protein TadD